MALDKNDLQSIKGVVVEVVDTRVSGLEKRIDGRFSKLVSEMDSRFTAQNKLMAQHFADLQAIMKSTYVNREEFEERYNDLQNEVDDLRQRIKQLEGIRAS